MGGYRDSRVTVSWTLELLGRRPSKFARDDKLSVPLHVITSSSPSLTDIASLTRTDSISDGPRLTDDNWHVVPKPTLIPYSPPLFASLSWRVLPSATLQSQYLDLSYRLFISIPHEGATWSYLAESIMRNIKVSVSQRTTLVTGLGEKGGKKGKVWVAPVVRVRLEEDMGKKVVRAVTNDERMGRAASAQWVLEGCLTIAKADLRPLDTCNAQVTYAITAQATDPHLSNQVYISSRMPTVRPFPSSAFPEGEASLTSGSVLTRSQSVVTTSSVSSETPSLLRAAARGIPIPQATEPAASSSLLPAVEYSQSSLQWHGRRFDYGGWAPAAERVGSLSGGRVGASTSASTPSSVPIREEGRYPYIHSQGESSSSSVPEGFEPPGRWSTSHLEHPPQSLSTHQTRADWNIWADGEEDGGGLAHETEMTLPAYEPVDRETLQAVQRA